MNIYALFLLILTTLISNTAIAETSLSVQPLLHRFEYTEFSQTGQRLDRETGWLPGLSIQASTRLWDWMNASWNSKIISGTVEYNQLVLPPIVTTTDTRIISHGIRLAIPVLSKSELFYSSTYYRWDRDIQGSSGYYEKYNWWELSAGAKTEVWHNNNESIYLELGLIRIHQPKIFVDWTKFNRGTVILQIGEDYGGRFQLEWLKRNSSGWAIGLNAYLEFWDFARSNTRKTTTGFPVIGGLTEPRSETRNLGLQLSTKYMF